MGIQMKRINSIENVQRNYGGKWDEVWECVKILPLDGTKWTKVSLNDKADIQRVRVSMSSRANREYPPFEIRTHKGRESPKNGPYILYLWKQEKHQS